MKKKLVCLLLSLTIWIAPVAMAEVPEASGDGSFVTLELDTALRECLPVQAGTVATIGTSVEPGGYFSTDLWGMNAADIDIRNLLHGYRTVAWTRSSQLTMNGIVVSGAQVLPLENGNHQYYVSFMQDLQYNDGTPITARDYLFSILLSCSQEAGMLGANVRGFEHLVGFDDYRSGATEELAGVRKIDEYTISLEIKSEYLPYFYGLAMLDVTPYPMHVIAPGCDVFDDGSGAYIGRGADADELGGDALEYTPGEFSAEMLEETLLNPETGYVFNPRVTSGAYALQDYDNRTKTATLVVNPLYLGNYEGQRPRIERLVVKPYNEATAVSDMAEGKYDILSRVSTPAMIEGFQSLVAQKDGALRSASYPRTGLAGLAFACERGVTSSANVRRAIAHIVDKEPITQEAVGVFGMQAHGYYGMGQWMIAFHAPEDEARELSEVNASAAREALALAYDMDAAKELLEADGWVLNAQGEAYADGIRYRDEDGELVPLVIKWAKTANNNVADKIEETISGPFAQAGIGLEITEMPYTEMTDHYYRIKDRTYDMFFLSTNFSTIYDPYFDYHTSDFYQGSVNTTGLQDEGLMELAWAMRETAPQDMHAYVLSWLAFQERWVELMPMVPLYSGIYFDFYTASLQDYEIAGFSSWSDAILHAYFAEGDA